MRLSLDQVAAALYGYSAEPDELTDPECVRSLVAEAVLNGGCQDLGIRHADTAAMQPGSERAAYLGRCRDAAAAVIEPTSGGPQ